MEDAQPVFPTIEDRLPTENEGWAGPFDPEARFRSIHTFRLERR